MDPNADYFIERTARAYASAAAHEFTATRQQPLGIFARLSAEADEVASRTRAHKTLAESYRTTAFLMEHAPIEEDTYNGADINPHKALLDATLKNLDKCANQVNSRPSWMVKCDGFIEGFPFGRRDDEKKK